MLFINEIIRVAGLPKRSIITIESPPDNSPDYSQRLASEEPDSTLAGNGHVLMSVPSAYYKRFERLERLERFELKPDPKPTESFQIEVGIFDFAVFPFVSLHTQRAEHDKILALVVDHLVNVVLMATAGTYNIKFRRHIDRLSLIDKDDSWAKTSLLLIPCRLLKTL
ncbi:MAG: hypothetical protein ABW172_07825 [Candidatus Binatia bacterium]